MEAGRRLIIQAFMQARESGKRDWYRMTPAVLKNRLLSLTEREFSEAAYGASSLTDFVLRFSDILTLDNVHFPTAVELKQEERTRLGLGTASSVPRNIRVHFPTAVELKQEERTRLGLGTASSVPRNIRIKRELWTAIFDRSSGNTYYWLAELGRVGTSPTERNCPILPTIDVETDRQWRQSFVESLPVTPTGVRDWANSLLPLSQLPQDLRYEWNRTLTENVHQRLLRWFKDRGIDPPPDIVTEVEQPQEGRATELEGLRRLVQQVVQEMTEEELSQLTLPPRAVLKAMTAMTQRRQ